MSVLWRNWLTFVAVLAIVLGTLGLLSVLQHDAILVRLLQQRLSVIAETTASSFRTVIRLGLPVSTMRNAEAVLTRNRQIDPAVSSIRIFNPSGILVHATDPKLKAPVAPKILQVQAVSGSDRWSAQTETELLAGYSIRNAAGTIVAGVLVASSLSDFTARSKAMERRIAIASGVILVIFAALALVVLRTRLGGAIRGWRRSRSGSARPLPAGPVRNAAHRMLLISVSSAVRLPGWDQN